MKKIVGISLGFGDIYDEGGIGKLHQPLDGSIARFNAVAKCKPELIICTAGYSRKSPTAPSKERKLSLAHQLNRYVTEYDQKWEHRLFTRPLCWSTRNEIRVGIKIAKCRDIDGVTPFVLVIASNLTHLPRICMYTKLYAPKNWRVKLVRARHHFSVLDHSLEPPKIARDIIYIVKVLWRLRRYQAALR